MASSTTTSFLLAMAALAALLAVGSCGTTLSWTIGKGSSPTRLVLVANAPVSEVSIKAKGGEWTDDLKESPAKTFTLDSKSKTIEGPICVRFAVKGRGYRTSDDIIPAGFKAGSVYKTKEQV